jgi:undecaprenyl-diphosphatase
MTLLHALVLGIVEGITEFLPISSTGHLILASKVMGLQDTDFLKTFEIVIQLGAIGAVAVLYARRILENRKLIKPLAYAFLPTGILGLTAYKFVKGYLLGNEAVVVWSLLIGGIAIIAFEYFYKRRKERAAKGLDDFSAGSSVGIGLFQSLAMVPGVSRSAATIIGGLMLGFERTAIVEFSFMLAIPTMAAASGYDLLKSAGSFDMSQAGVLAVGFAASFAVAYGVVKLFLRYVQTHTFVPFGIYRIAVALAFLMMM